MKIKEFLTESNWTKGSYFLNDDKDYLVKKENWTPENYNGKCCLIGAIDLCYNNYTERLEVETKISQEIINRCNYHGITRFNDDSRTTFSDIKEIVNKLNV